MAMSSGSKLVMPLLVALGSPLSSCPFLARGSCVSLPAPGLSAIPGLREHLRHAWTYDRERDVSVVKGVVLALRRKAFDEVHGFDNSFFMYYEEMTSTSARARGLGAFASRPLRDVVHSRKTHSEGTLPWPSSAQFDTGTVPRLESDHAGAALRATCSASCPAVLESSPGYRMIGLPGSRLCAGPIPI